MNLAEPGFIFIINSIIKRGNCGGGSLFCFNGYFAMFVIGLRRPAVRDRRQAKEPPKVVRFACLPSFLAKTRRGWGSLAPAWKGRGARANGVSTDREGSPGTPVAKEWPGKKRKRCFCVGFVV